MSKIHNIKDNNIITPGDLVGYVEAKKSRAAFLVKEMTRHLENVVDSIDLNALERKMRWEHKIVIKNLDFILGALERMKNNSQEDQDKTVSFHVNYSKGTKEAHNALNNMEDYASEICEHYSKHKDKDRPMLNKLRALVKSYNEETEELKQDVTKYLENKNYARAALLLVDYAPLETEGFFEDGGNYTYSPKTEAQLNERGDEIKQWCQKMMEEKVPRQHILNAEVSWYTDKIQEEQRRLATVNRDVLTSIMDASPTLSEKEAPPARSRAIQRMNKLSRGLEQVYRLIALRREKEKDLIELQKKNSTTRDLGSH